MLWSILIPTVGYRQAKFLALVNDVLLPQMTDGVEIVALHNNGERAVGQYRQELLMAAYGDYVSFIDDDDLVSGDYVSAVIPALAAKPDVVAFEVCYTSDGGPPLRSLNSISYTPHDDWANMTLYRDLTHVQPIRVDLARLGDFSKGWPEDYTWRCAVRPHLRTEVCVDRVLYYYRHSSGDSVQAGMLPGMPKLERFQIDSPHFRYVEAP
jgi:Glycosyl transferase family 2